LKRKFSIISIVALIFNSINIFLTNYLFIFSIFIFTIGKKIPITFIFGYVFCFAQFILLNNLENFLKNISLFSILFIIFRIKKRNISFLTSITKTILFIHLLAFLMFLTFDFNGIGNSRPGDKNGFIGFFDEPSVVGYVLGTLLLVNRFNIYTNSILIFFLIIAKGMTSQLYLIFYIVTRKYFKYDFLFKVLFLLILFTYVSYNHDLRIYKEFLLTLSQLFELESVDLTKRTSSSGFRILHEATYSYNILKEMSLNTFIGGSIYTFRTASLNTFTEVLINSGLIGLLIALFIATFNLKIFKLNLSRITCIFLLTFCSGAYLKPIYILCITAIIASKQNK